ncbi:hypothetical protein BGZ83_001558 [Gryganskiella cystojenkinii]|nr:hypothetical protein BGZ83_001558 [Gryganskiella cystojenkinii]
MDDIPEIEQRNVEAKRRNAAIMAGISLGADSIYTPSTHLSVKPVPVERAPKRHGSKWENVEPTRKSQRVMGTSPVFKDLSSLKMDERDENSKAQPIRKGFESNTVSSMILGMGLFAINVGKRRSWKSSNAGEKIVDDGLTAVALRDDMQTRRIKLPGMIGGVRVARALVRAASVVLTLDCRQRVGSRHR